MNRSFIVRIVLSLLLIGLALFSALFSTGCSAEPSPTPTPTKTPTIVPTSTATVFIPTPTFTFTPMVVSSTSTPTSEPTPTQVRVAAVRPTSTPTRTPVLPTPTMTATLTPTLETELQTSAKMVVVVPTSTPAPAPPAGDMPASLAMGGNINPLTGLSVNPANLNRRPLGVKVPNFPVVARPQSGLSLADVVVEHEAEANLTRFTAIFYGNDVGLLGPIRSLRLPDGELMPIFKSALVASGGHPAVKIRITQGKAWASGYKRVICPEEPFTDGGAEYRMTDKKPRYELTMYSDTASLWNVLSARGANQRQDFHNMFVFSETPPGGGRDATHLRIVYKPTYSIAEYRYDGASHTYKRFDLGTPTMDALTGKQIAPSNVIVLYANHYNSDILADAHDPNNLYYSIIIELWGQGTAKLMRDGKLYDVRWIRENAQQAGDRLIFVDAQGNQVPFRPGSTWIQLVRPDANIVID